MMETLTSTGGRGFVGRSKLAVSIDKKLTASLPEI